MQYFPLNDSPNSLDTTRTSIETRDSQRTFNKIDQNERYIHVTRVNNWDKPMEVGNPNIKAPNEEERHDQKAVELDFSGPVTVTRVNKKENIQQKDENARTNEQQNGKVRCLTAVKSPPISIIKLTRNKTATDQQNNKINIKVNDLTTNDGKYNQDLNQRLRTSSVAFVSVTKVNGKTARLTEHSINPSLSPHQKRNLDQNVTVVKVQKRSS